MIHNLNILLKGTVADNLKKEMCGSDRPPLLIMCTFDTNCVLKDFGITDRLNIPLIIPCTFEEVLS